MWNRPAVLCSLSGASDKGSRTWADRARKMKAEKIFKLAKGFRGRAKNTIRIARNRVEKALQYSYRDRKAKKREWRELWIQKINAAAREHGVKYNELMHCLLYTSPSPRDVEESRMPSSA